MNKLTAEKIDILAGSIATLSHMNEGPEAVLENKVKIMNNLFSAIQTLLDEPTEDNEIGNK